MHPESIMEVTILKVIRNNCEDIKEERSILIGREEGKLHSQQLNPYKTSKETLETGSDNIIQFPLPHPKFKMAIDNYKIGSGERRGRNSDCLI